LWVAQYVDSCSSVVLLLGAQGGDLDDECRTGLNCEGTGIIKAEDPAAKTKEMESTRMQESIGCHQRIQWRKRRGYAVIHVL